MGKYGPHLDEPIQPRLRETGPAPEPAAQNPTVSQTSAAPVATPAPVTSSEAITIYVIQDTYIPPPSPVETWQMSQQARVLAAAGLIRFGDAVARTSVPPGKRHAPERAYKQEVQACSYAQASSLIGKQPDGEILPRVQAHADDPMGLGLELAKDCSMQACDTAYAGDQADTCRSMVKKNFE